jgi:hypothetical protein
MIWAGTNANATKNASSCTRKLCGIEIKITQEVMYQVSFSCSRYDSTYGELAVDGWSPSPTGRFVCRE